MGSLMTNMNLTPLLSILVSPTLGILGLEHQCTRQSRFSFFCCHFRLEENTNSKGKSHCRVRSAGDRHQAEWCRHTWRIGHHWRRGIWASSRSGPWESHEVQQEEVLVLSGQPQDQSRLRDEETGSSSREKDMGGTAG